MHTIMAERYIRFLHIAAKGGSLSFVKTIARKRELVNKPDCNGRTALHGCCQYGHLEVAKCLLENNADVNIQDKDGLTSLHAASGNGHLAVAKILIENKADVHKQDNGGWTPLHLASMNGHLAVVEVLIEKGVFVHHTSYNGTTALHPACLDGHVGVAKILIENNADVDKQDNDGWTPLHVASQNGHLAVVELLIENNADIDKQNNDGWTPLHAASLNGYLAVVELLIEKGALINHMSHNGTTALHICCQEGHVDVAKFLIENKAAVNKVSDNGWTSLHYYVKKHHDIDFIRYLINMGAKPNACQHLQCTPLHVAAEEGNHLAVFALISLGCQVNLADKNGETAFIKAAQSDSLDTLKILEELSDIYYKDKDGNNALHHAVMSENTMAVQYLIGIGVDVNSFNNLHQTPLHFASEFGHNEIANILLQNGAHVNRVDIDKSTPLHLAAKEGQADIVNILIECGTNIEAKDISNRTPLSVASLRGQSSVVQILLQEVAEVDQGDLNGQTALHLAASYGYFDVVQQIMDKYPNTATVQDNSGFTPADLAMKKGYQDIADYIQSVTSTKYTSFDPPKAKRLKPSRRIRGRNDVLQSLDKHVATVCQCLGPTWISKRVGSSYEGTRIGDPNESDYLLADLRIAVLYRKEMELTGDTAFCTCKVSQDIPQEYKTAVKVDGKCNILSSVEYHRLFRDIVCQSICELEDADGLIKCIENVHDEYKRQAAASKCALMWIGNDKFAGMIIDTDFVPSIIMYDWPGFATKPENLIPGLEYKEPLFENGIPYIYLVAKPPHADSDLGQRLSTSQRDCLWRIDFAHVCSRIVASLPPRLKNVYIMAKGVRGDMGRLLHPDTGKPIMKPRITDQTAQAEYEVKDLVTSYQLKVTFLHKVRNTFWHKSDMTLDKMVLMVYDQLVHYLEEKKIPDFVLHKSDILAGTKHTHEECLPAAIFARDFVQKQAENGGLDQDHMKSVL